MVDGIVVPPAIDLRNPELIDSHLQAEWLAASGVALAASIADNLDMTAAGKPLLPHHWQAVCSPETLAEATKRITAVLDAVARDYGAAPPEWFAGVDQATTRILGLAPQRFASAFDRWRDLLAAAERQVEDATRTLDDYSISPDERRAAEARLASGNVQRRLLLRGGEGQNSDFYVYRYLATEGFLPGYNFPRLPLMAFVPGGQGGKGQRYLQRARFLAISEFGPGSLVYHEGQAYRVDRALLRDAGGGPDGLLPTFSTAICPVCGAAHDGEPPERCHVCENPLGGSNITRDLYRIENVGTRPVERITANDEERRRQGYDLQTTFSFRQAADFKSRMVEDGDGELLSAAFAPATLVRRINRGLRRRKPESGIGFVIDPKSGYWAGTNSDGDDGPNPLKTRQRITPVVEDRKNALLVRFPPEWIAAAGDDSPSVIATIQHALARGIEGVYQLEEAEILVEPTPSRTDRRALLFYEAAEGGAGALSRLIEDKDGFRKVAEAALEIMHYDLKSLPDAKDKGPSALRNVEGTPCVAGCYRCLLSYFNQPDHALIDRRREAVIAFLVRLAFADVKRAPATAAPLPGLDGCPPPDAEPLALDGYRVDYVWRRARVAAAEQAKAPRDLGDRLAAKGIELVILPEGAAERREAIMKLVGLLGGVTA